MYLLVFQSPYENAWSKLQKKKKEDGLFSIKSKHPSLRKKQECKKSKNRIVQGKQEEQQCYLIRIISTFQNWTHGKGQAIKREYNMKFSNTWSISPQVCDCYCLPGSAGTNTEQPSLWPSTVDERAKVTEDTQIQL
jgi:isopenicillin N synthase-like dioxygenase